MFFQKFAYKITNKPSDMIFCIELIVDCYIYCDIIQLDKDCSTIALCINKNGTKGNLVAKVFIDDIKEIWYMNNPA